MTQLDFDLKLKLCRKQLYATTQVRYLDILIDDKLTGILILITLFQNLWEELNFIQIKMFRAGLAGLNLGYLEFSALKPRKPS